MGTTRYELTRLTTKAIREAVANAVAHRDYQLSGSAVEINLTRRELTVTSPGRFIEPVTSQNLLHAHAALDAVLDQSRMAVWTEPVTEPSMRMGTVLRWLDRVRRSLRCRRGSVATRHVDAA